MRPLPFRFFLLVLACGAVAFWLWPDDERFAGATPHDISLKDGALEYRFASAAPGSVGDFLAQNGFPLEGEDRVLPERDTPLASGMRIVVERSRDVSLEADGQTRTLSTRLTATEDILRESGVTLDEDDIVLPGRSFPVADGATVQIIRVVVSEETEEEAIAFETEEREDDDLSWRTRKVTQKGEAGVRQLTYRVSRHDGKEVNRKLLKEEVVKEPVTEIVTQGTHVEVGKKHTGAASWYAHTGTLSAANPWLPMGSYVRVTNRDNGKSVIVRINDRGPFGPGRIIDLDKVAFAKIASLGAGVVNVTMEEITN